MNNKVAEPKLKEKQKILLFKQEQTAKGGPDGLKKLKLKPSQVKYIKHSGVVDMTPKITNVKNSLKQLSATSEARRTKQQSRQSGSRIGSPGPVITKVSHSSYSGPTYEQMLAKKLKVQAMQHKKKENVVPPQASKKLQIQTNYATTKSQSKKQSIKILPATTKVMTEQEKNTVQKISFGRKLENKYLFSDGNENESVEIDQLSISNVMNLDNGDQQLPNLSELSIEEGSENVEPTQRISQQVSFIASQRSQEHFEDQSNQAELENNLKILKEISMMDPEEGNSENSENLSNLSDDERKHLVKDDNLRPTTPHDDTRKTFGENAASSIKGVSQKRRPEAAEPSKKRQERQKASINIQDVRKKVFEQEDPDNLYFKYKTNSNVAKARNTPSKFLSMNLEPDSQASSVNEDFAQQLESDRLHDPTSERQPADKSKQVWHSVRKVPNKTLNNRTPTYERYEQLLQSSTVSVDYNDPTKTPKPQDNEVYSALKVGKKISGQAKNDQNSASKTKTVDEKQHFQEEDFDQDGIMENFDVADDNLDVTKNLMNAFSLPQGLQKDESIYNNSDYNQRKMNFMNSTSEISKSNQNLLKTQKMNFNNIFQMSQKATRQNHEFQMMENQYFSVQHENVKWIQNQDLMQQSMEIKSNDRMQSMIAGVRPSTIGGSKAADQKYSSSLAARRGSINAVKDISLSRSTYKKKNYTMDQKSTQTELLITGKDIKFVTVNMLNMNLKLINFSENKILYLPDEICDLPNLAELRVEKNNLKQLPAEIGKMRNLRYFNASHNDLRSLPESLSLCVNLLDLVLNDNKIEQLPSKLQHWERLKTLNIQNNRIYQLPTSFSSLSKVQVLSFEWFQYLDPPQAVHQSGAQGQFVIDMLREFCRCQLKVEGRQIIGKLKTFSEFIAYIYISTPLKEIDLTASQIVEGVNELRFSMKKRCLVQTICSNKHPHLLQEIINTKSDCLISELINRNINLNILDVNDQAPLLGSLRQTTSEYAQILLGSNSATPLDLNKLSFKHGYPLHIAILTEKFDIAFDLLHSPATNAHVLNTIGANIIHLLFVKYDKDAETALRILHRCLALGVNVNLVDQIYAAPIHIALRKKQYQAIKDMVKINTASGHQVFDFNIKDKRGQTPLHFAVEKQDYDMFHALICDEWIDANMVETEDFYKARRLSVIFSAFHKMLYRKEKFPMRVQFALDVRDHYIDFESTDLIPLRNKFNSQKKGAPPAPISVSNKAKKSLDFTSAQSRMRAQSPAYFEKKNLNNTDLAPFSIDYINMNDHQRFYDELNDESMFVKHRPLNFRELRKMRTEKKQVVKPTPLIIPQVARLEQRGRGRDNYDSVRQALDARSLSIMSKASKSSNIMQVNSNSQYFKSEAGHRNHKRQKSMQNYQDVNSQYHKLNQTRNCQRNLKQEFMSVTRPQQNTFNLECDANISEFQNNLEMNFNMQNLDNMPSNSDEEIAQEEDFSCIENEDFDLNNSNSISMKRFHPQEDALDLTAKNLAHASASPRNMQQILDEKKNKTSHKPLALPFDMEDPRSDAAFSSKNYFSQQVGSKVHFGPKPVNLKTQNQSSKHYDTAQNKPVDNNIDDIHFDIPTGSGDPEPKQPPSGTSSRKRAQGGGQKESTKIYIGNLNINLNNVFINLKDVSIPSSPSDQQQQRNGQSTNIGQMVRNNLQQRDLKKNRNTKGN